MKLIVLILVALLSPPSIASNERSEESFLFPEPNGGNFKSQNDVPIHRGIANDHPYEENSNYHGHYSSSVFDHHERRFTGPIDESAKVANIGPIHRNRVKNACRNWVFKEVERLKKNHKVYDAQCIIAKFEYSTTGKGILVLGQILLEKTYLGPKKQASAPGAIRNP